MLSKIKPTICLIEKITQAQFLTDSILDHSKKFHQWQNLVTKKFQENIFFRIFENWIFEFWIFGEPTFSENFFGVVKILSEQIFH